jgi:tetratricopeptide (TPR) repeat protein
MSLYPDYLESRYFDQTRRLEEGVYDLLGHCRSVGEIRSGYARLYSNLGAAQLRLRNFEAAKQAFERALEIEPTLIEPYEQLAFLYQQQGKQAVAYRALSRARFQMAERALAADSLDIAQANNQEALDFNVADAASHAQRAEIILKRNDNPEKARSWLERAEELDAKHPRVWMAWGRYHLAQNDWASAQKAFRKVMELDPNSRRGLENLITALRSAGFEDQIDVYKARKYYLEGTEFQFAGYWDQALNAYEQAAKLDSLQADYWAAQGYVWAKKHIHETAQSLFDKALSLDADNAMAWYGRGVVAGDQGRYQEAIDALKRALEADPDPGKVHYALAVNYYFQNRIDMAWKHLQQALKMGVSVNPSFRNELKKVHAENMSP